MNVPINLAVHYHQQRTDKKDNNDGLLFGIYTYSVPEELVDTEDMYNNDIVHVQWFGTEKKRDNNM